MSRRVWAAATLGVIVVIAVGAPAAVASYRHARTVVERSGDAVMAPWLALTTDGMLLAALVVIWVRRLAGKRVGAGPWAALWVGMIATLAANLAAAQSTPEGFVVALWPPICLAITLELVALLLVPSRVPEAQSPAQEPVESPAEGVEDTALDPPSPQQQQERRRAVRTRAHRSPSDEAIASLVREWPADPDKPAVTRNNVMHEFRIGTSRAANVLRMVKNPGSTPTPIRWVS